MSSVRMHVLVTGVALAVAAVLLALSGNLLGADLPKVTLLGVASGAVLGLVPDRSPGARAGAFLIGFLATWLGYALRAGFLPDSGTGRAMAAAFVVLAVTFVAVATAARLPLWAGFVGIAAMAGAYETVFTATPTAFTSESMTALTTVSLATAFCFLVSLFAAGTAGVVEAVEEAPAAQVHRLPVVPAPRAAAEDLVPLTNAPLTEKGQATA